MRHVGIALPIVKTGRCVFTFGPKNVLSLSISVALEHECSFMERGRRGKLVHRDGFTVGQP
jgi:hypothetical protein